MFYLINDLCDEGEGVVVARTDALRHILHIPDTDPEEMTPPYCVIDNLADDAIVKLYVTKFSTIFPSI